MSHNSFDDSVVSRLGDNVSARQDSAISINSLTANDFKDYDNISRRSDPISSRIDSLTIDNIPGLQTKGRGGLSARGDDYFGTIEMKPAFEMKPRPNSISDFDFGIRDRPTRYPLPMEAVAHTGESALHQLNERIVNKAVAKVQESMTPAEKQALNKDSEKYAEQMRKYEEEMKTAMTQKWFNRRPEDWPRPPEKPQSLVKYEAAIDREIALLVKRASV